jgi:cytoskeletal protein RodZ
MLLLKRMPSVAEQLRQAREKQSMTIEQLAEATKIKSDHLRALESGRYEIFSAPVYIRGFARSCANVLRLNSAALLSDLDEELAQTKKFREPPSLTGQPRGVVDFMMLQLSKINWRAAVPIIGIGVAVCGLILLLIWWQNYQEADPLSELGPGLYRPPNTNSGDVLPLPGVPRSP